MLLNSLENLSIHKITLVATYVAQADLYPMKNAGRYRHAFIYTDEGTEVYHFKDKTVYAVPHSILYIPKGEQYTIDLIGEQSIAHVFDFEAAFDEPLRPFLIKFSKSNEVKALFQDSEKVWKRQQVGYAALCNANLYKVIHWLIKQECSYLNTHNFSVIAEAVDYLHKHYLENNFKIETLYEIADISPKHFENLFYKQFKTTPKKYTIALKMEQAKELLLSEKLSIGDVAEQLGYCDVYHFSKAFKSKIGLTPGEFRRRTQSVSHKPISS